MMLRMMGGAPEQPEAENSHAHDHGEKHDMRGVHGGHDTGAVRQAPAAPGPDAARRPGETGEQRAGDQGHARQGQKS